MLFSELASYYDRLEAVPSRLKMIEILSELLKGTSAEEIKHTIYMTQGVLAPPFEAVEFGVAEKLVEEALAIATGHEKSRIEKEFRKSGDLGLAAQVMKAETRLKPLKSESYSITEVYDAMRKIAETGGHGSKDLKIKMLANLVASSSSVEIKYIVRYLLGQLRMGVGDSTILESLSVMATGKRELKPLLEHAYNICSDLGLVGYELKKGGEEAIRDFHVTLFKPIRPALAERLPTAEEIIERMHGKAAVEQKYDGFRVQVHKNGNKVKLFSRRLEDTTEMFPDIVRAVIAEVRASSIILDSEALAFDDVTGEFHSFQETIQRKRKHGIAAKVEEMPLRLFAFDIMFCDGKDCMRMPYEKRRELLEHVLDGGSTIVPTTRIVTSSPKELELFFEKSVEEGLEGIMAKELNGEYIAGARKFSWIKMKRSYKGELSDTIDLVIVGYYLGKGNRTEFKFGGLLGAVYNKKKDIFETISRIGTGFTEVQMSQLKTALDRIKSKTKPVRVEAIVEPDFWVYPKYVITVRADEITRSPTHTCGRERQSDGTETGYALRFPRIVGEEAIRQDKSIEDATTTEEIIELFKAQRKIAVGER